MNKLIRFFNINIVKDSLRLVKRELFILEWYIFPDRDQLLNYSFFPFLYFIATFISRWLE